MANSPAISNTLVSQHQIQLDDLFSASFMKAHTKFSTIDDFLAVSGFGIQSQADFEKIAAEKWNPFVKEQTNFASWNEMQEVAYQEWIARCLN